MKLIFIFIVALTFSLKANAHEYFFGFAELSYHSDEKRFEGTLVLSTHDLEEWLKSKGLEIDEIELHEDDIEFIFEMEKFLFQGFKIENDGDDLTLQSIGFEVLETGVTHIYFHSSTTENPETIDVTYNLLMDKFPKQHNKITYRHGKDSYTAVFMPNKTKSSISLR